MSKTDGGSILLFTDTECVDIMELKERVYHAEQEENTEKESENAAYKTGRCENQCSFNQRMFFSKHNTLMSK